jgi:hypothetical protein
MFVSGTARVQIWRLLVLAAAPRRLEVPLLHAKGLPHLGQQLYHFAARPHAADPTNANLDTTGPSAGAPTEIREVTGFPAIKVQQ